MLLFSFLVKHDIVVNVYKSHIVWCKVYKSFWSLTTPACTGALKPFNMQETLYRSDINERKRLLVSCSESWLKHTFWWKGFGDLSKKSEAFHGNMPVSLKPSPWICTSQWQREARGKGARQRNRQPCPDRSGMRFTFPAWITEIRELDVCLPASSTTELFIHLERRFFFCTILFCF